MLENVKLMSLDAESYYRWIEQNEDVAMDYSNGEKTLNSLNDKEEPNRRLY